MHQNHEMLPGAFCLTALATAFCVWSAAGNEVNLCITVGCALFHETTLAGISLWWFGAAAFAVLALLALAGAARWGTLVANLALLADTGLLLLMAATAPCLSCLMVAVFFAASYALFRHAAFHRRMDATALKNTPGPGPSVLLLAWGLLFIINAGAAVRTQVDVWALTDNAQDATVRLFFSPSCPSCREAVTLLSGHVDVAFYPVAENEADFYKTARMQQLLNEGNSMAEALSAAQSVTENSSLTAFSPDRILLRLRLLRNKAHVFLAGSQTIPFLEYQGLPSMLRDTNRPRRSERRKPVVPPLPPLSGADSIDLPLDPQIAGQCSGTAPCP